MWFLPLSDDNPIARTAAVTPFLIALCAGAFMWQLGQQPIAVFYSYGMTPAELFGYWHPGPLYQVVPVWAKVLTSMFLHGGWMHLITNMMVLWVFGNSIEGSIGPGRYLFLYLYCGIAAALTQAFSAPASHVPMVGASGAIAGVTGAYFLLLPRANVRCFIWIVFFFRVINIPGWILLGAWLAMQIASGMAQGSGRPGVAFWAHVGGFVGGIIVITFLRPQDVELLQPARTRVFAASPLRNRGE
jgi:membrane associated rhomboid family serine protease